MEEITNVRIGSIDPESRINVRRTAVEDNVEKVKDSIRNEGYWSDQPIIVRPHPEPSSEYQYEYVTGQCRFRACQELGLEEIPAVVKELDDDQAIQRSWLENEKRGELTSTDKSYWVQRIFKRYAGSGYDGKEALELAAKYLGVTPQTAQNYYRLVVLPREIMDKIDQGIIPQRHAIAIAKTTVDMNNWEQAQERMKERAEWFVSLDREQRKYFPDVLEMVKPKAPIDELGEALAKLMSKKKSTLEVKVPADLLGQLLKWGRERGLEDTETILSHMLTEVLRRNTLK